MSNITPYYSKNLSLALSRPARVEGIIEAAMLEVADLRVFAVKEVHETLNRAAKIMPNQMTEEQLRHWKYETRRYLMAIEGIGYCASQRVLAAVEEIIALPSGR